MDAAIDDVEFLARSPYRFAVLDALADRPRDRHGLREATGVSGPTLARILGDFEDRRWIVRRDAAYDVTPLGAFVAERFGNAVAAMGTAAKLGAVVDWLPVEMDDFDVESFADAVVSVPGPGYPYEPVERVSELIESADSMRGFSTTVLKSANLEALCDGILAGMETEVIYPTAVFETVLAWDRGRAAEAAACENCTVLLHDDLPDQVRCGFAIFDDRVALCCHDYDTGALRAIVDTDATDAVEWAEAVYARHRVAARTLDLGDLALPVDSGTGPAD